MAVLFSEASVMFNAYLPLVIGVSLKVIYNKLALGFEETHASSPSRLLCWRLYHNGSYNKWLKSFPWLRGLTGLILSHNEEVSQKYHVYLVFGLCRDHLRKSRFLLGIFRVFSGSRVNVPSWGSTFQQVTLFPPPVYTLAFYILHK